jgi:uncharacterized protein YndB with AHSA1/START domain
MSQTTSNAVHLHFVLKAPPERVYRAFLDPDAQAKWLPPHGFTCKVHEFNPRAGGRFRMSFVNFTNGQSHSFYGDFVELVPNELIRYTDQFESDQLPGTIHVRIAFKPCLIGTEVTVDQTDIPGAIPVEMCYAGWQESIQLLKLLVEAEVK